MFSITSRSFLDGIRGGRRKGPAPRSRRFATPLKPFAKTLLLLALTGGLGALVLHQALVSKPIHTGVLNHASPDAPPKRAPRHDPEEWLKISSNTVSSAANAEAVVDDRALHSEALAQEIGGLAAVQIPGRLERLSSSELRGEPGRLLIRRWAELDPNQAGEWVRQLADPKTLRELAEALSLAWGDRDFPGALTWTRTLEIEAVRNDISALLSDELARTAPTEAMRLVLTLPENATRNGALLHALSQWADASPETAREWASQLPTGSLREAALGAVAVVIASRDGPNAARLIATELPPGPNQERAAVSILQQWAQSDPRGALGWVEQFSAGNLQTAAMDNVVRIWSVTDPQSVGLWLDQLPPGGFRDAASASFSAWLASGFPAEAAEWANFIADPLLRHQELDRIARERAITCASQPPDPAK